MVRLAPTSTMLLLLLAMPLARGAAADASRDHPRRRLPNAKQNMCGASWSAAIQCSLPCPGGTNEECSPGEMCFAEVDCPLPPTISPAPTRSPVKGFDLGNHDKEIIGYYASWQWYDRAKLAKPANMDFNKVTRVNYAFFQLDSMGNIWGTDEWADPRVLFGDVVPNSGSCEAGQPGCRCSWVKPEFKSCAYHQDSTGLIWMAHAARAEVYPSIGGWTLSDAFPPMAANPTSRAIFARKCRQLIEDYDFDGIDLDWEYPGYAAHSGTPQDKQNFNLLLQDIRKELDDLGTETGRFYGLTAALPCGPSNIDNIDIQTVSQYLTEFNLMSYDFHGSWDTHTGVNSPLYDQSSDPAAGWSVDGCVKNWVARGAPKERLNIGLGFYGRSYRNSKELNAIHGGTDDSNWAIDEGTPQYFNIVEQIGSMTVEWDDETQTPYAYFDDGGLVSYDDERSICLKTEYAIEENLNGFIIWELSGDVMQDLNTPLLDIMNRKLSESDTNCADPFGPKLDSPTALLASASELPNTTIEATASATTASATPEAQSITFGSSNEIEEQPKLSSSSFALGSTTLETSAGQGASLSQSISSAMKPMTTTKIDIPFEKYSASGRKQVKRDTSKPKKPYRPPKVVQEL